MEENKYFCPECGNEMIAIYDKPALNLSCPKCGCKIATSKWEEIDLDKTIYVLKLDKIQSPSIDEIKLISRLTGDNFIKTKNDLIIGHIIFENRAYEIKCLKELLDKSRFKYIIKPDFNY